MTRLTQRMPRLEARWRPKSIAADLQRVPACPPADLRACLLDEFPRDRETCDALMAQRPDAALAALMEPEAARLMHTLAQNELEALARRDPAASWRVLGAPRDAGVG